MKLLPGIVLIIVIAACVEHSPHDSVVKNEHLKTFDVVIAGRSCKNPGQDTQFDCTYTVGSDLQFEISGVGLPEAGVTVNRARGIEGDYYLTFGLLHGCIIVKRGDASRSDGPEETMDIAFVSPKTGKVYDSWQDCGRAATNGI